MSSFLMWVGSVHYKAIADYSDEAVIQGISKRVPNFALAKAMMEPGSVVFIAHDEGEKTDCGDCLGGIECPDCRKSDTLIRAELTKLKEFADDEATALPPARLRTWLRTQKKLEALRALQSKCDVCSGTRLVYAGTGGWVQLKNGDKYDYRWYTYWRNLARPEIFDFKKDVLHAHMCVACGGTGASPNARVFGLFVPERIEYIAELGDAPDKLEVIVTSATIIPASALLLESKRKCGVRKPGGVYVVTSVAGDAAAASRALKKVEELGIDPGAAELHGSFVRFVRPVSIREKRFRGIKHWDYAPLEAKTSAVDVLDALA